MADADLRTRADERIEQALRESGARDPRDFYRGQLRELKTTSPEAYRKALAYYDGELVPAVAAEGSDPLGEWLEYGRMLASLTSPGRTVQVDSTGLAADYARPVPADHLVLHLPRDTGRPALVLGLPPRLSPPQRATYDLLVRQSQGA